MAEGRTTKVRVYSTPTCPWCQRAKEFLKANKIEFEDIDVSTNHKAADEMVERSGQMGVPVIDVDGTVIVGFDQERLKAALAL